MSLHRCRSRLRRGNWCRSRLWRGCRSRLRCRRRRLRLGGRLTFRSTGWLAPFFFVFRERHGSHQSQDDRDEPSFGHDQLLAPFVGQFCFTAKSATSDSRWRTLCQSHSAVSTNPHQSNFDMPCRRLFPRARTAADIILTILPSDRTHSQDRVTDCVQRAPLRRRPAFRK